MRNFKKLMAAVMAAAMSLALAAPAFAAGEKTDGSGTSAGTATVRPDPNNVVVVLPTVAKNSLDYIVDPQRLIQGTAGAAYASDVEFKFDGDNTTLYFQTASKKYSNSSPAQTITSKSFKAVTAYVYATVADNDVVRLATAPTTAGWGADVKYTDAKGVTTAKKPLVYLQLQETGAPDADTGIAAIKSGTTAVPVKNQGVSILAVNIGANTGLKAVYDSKAKAYVYGEPEGFDADTYTKGYFNITGKAKPIAADEVAEASAGIAVDANLASWAAVTSSTKMPTVSLTWSVVPTSQTGTGAHVADAAQSQTWTYDTTAANITTPSAIALTPGTAKVTKVAVSTTGFGLGETVTDCTTIANAKKVGFAEDSSNAGQIDYSAGLTIPAANFSKLKAGQNMYVRIFWDDDTINNITIADNYDPPVTT